MEGRLALMERNVREKCRYSHKQKPDPGQDFSNLTLELQSQEKRLAALQAQRDELLVGLKGLQESLKNQALRVTRLEGRLGELKGGQKNRGLRRANITPQDYNEPRKRNQTPRGGRPGRILVGHTQLRPEGVRSYSQTDNHSQATAQSRNSTQQQTKAQKSRPQSESHPQIQVQYANPKPQSTDSQPQLDPAGPKSQIHMLAQTRLNPIQQEQLQSRQTVHYPHTQIKPQVQQRPQSQLYHLRHHQLHNLSHPSWPQPPSQAPTHPKPSEDRQSTTHLEAPQSESYQPRVSGWGGGEQEENDTKVKSSVIHDLLQLPVRQKIPARPVPKKDATSK